MLSVRISSCGCTREVWRAWGKRKSCSRRSRNKLESFETLLLNSTGTFSRSVTVHVMSWIHGHSYVRVTPWRFLRNLVEPRRISQVTIDLHESKLKCSVKRKPNSQYYCMQIVIGSSLIAKIASGISGSIVYLPLRSARLNRLSDVETIFLSKDLSFLWLSVWYSVHPLCSS